MSVDYKLVELIRDRINQADAVFVLTGAGISKESGIPTFREPDGFWANYSLEDLATPAGFYRNPKLVWEWYEMRRVNCLQAQPNDGHKKLVELENYLMSKGKKFLLATQNIDGLHLRAGSNPNNLIELHGNINYCRPISLPAYPLDETKLIKIPEHGFASLPPYDSNNEMLRPHIVWFNELLNPSYLERCYLFLSHCDLCFSIGTMGAVFPAAEFPILAKERGALTVEINPAQTEISRYMDIIINLPASEALTLLCHQLETN